MLIKPVITEESMRSVAKNTYTFEVGLLDNKTEVAQEVAKVFGVTVLDVATSIRPGKTKRVGKKRTTIRRADRKMAYIKLKAGDKIGLFETAESAKSEKPVMDEKKHSHELKIKDVGKKVEGAKKPITIRTAKEK